MFCGLFAAFSLFLVNNLRIYPSKNGVHQYAEFVEGPRYAMFFGLSAAGLLSILHFMTSSEWMKFFLFIVSILSMGCAFFSLLALSILYNKRLEVAGVYSDIQDCGVSPNIQNNEFCVFNCTFVGSNDSNSQLTAEICSKICIPIGIVRKLHETKV